MPGAVASLVRLAPLWLMLSLPLPSQAIIFFATPDPSFNTSAPAGELANSGWDLQGRWGTFLGTPIAPNLFLTARHVGGEPGQLFSFRGTNYKVIDSFADPQSDLRIFKVCGIFPAYAPLQTAGDELGKSVVVFGRGTQRGAEVLVTGQSGQELKGWRWGGGDGVMRWGENIVSTNLNAGAGFGELLGMDFNAAGGPNEAHLSSGDSGGAVFIRDGLTWKLAGINFAVDGPFNTASTGPGFNAALFDAGGMYVTNSATAMWEELPETPTDLPSAFYVTRISANLTWINSVITQHAVESLPPVLESTPDLNDAFTRHPTYTVDEISQTITLTEPTGNLFIRLQNCLAQQIDSTDRVNGQWIIHYRP